MFIAHLGRAVRRSSLPSAIRHLLLTLGTYADVEGVCWPSRRELAAAMDVHPSTVSQYIREAAALGVVSQRRRRGSSAVYVIHLDKIELRQDVVIPDIKMSGYPTSQSSRCRDSRHQDVVIPVTRTDHQEQEPLRKEEEDPLDMGANLAPPPPPPDLGLEGLAPRLRPRVGERLPEHALDIGVWCGRWLQESGSPWPAAWMQWARAVLPYLSALEREELLSVGVADRRPNLRFLSAVVSRIILQGSRRTTTPINGHHLGVPQADDAFLALIGPQHTSMEAP